MTTTDGVWSDAIGEPAETLLELRGVRAAYDGIDVLYGVDLVLQPGQVHALLGPNGAGKSTTLKVASGQIRPSSTSRHWPVGSESTRASAT